MIHINNCVYRILREKCNGKLDESSVPEHLRRLVGTFRGEDPHVDETLQNFHETEVYMNF